MTMARSHWCTESTNLKPFKWFEARIRGDRAWIVVVDGNSVRRSAVVQEAFLDQHPNLTFSTANTTDIFFAAW